jgi:hypothetical protein
VEGAIFHGVEASPQEGEQLLRALSVGLDVSAVALYRLAGDGVLRLVASFGYPEDVVRGWQAIPQGVDIPITRATLTRTTVVLRSRVERLRRFPALRGLQVPHAEATINVPVLDGDRVVGGLIFSWDGEREFDGPTVAHAGLIARTGGPLLVRQAAAADQDLAFLRCVLEVLFDPWLLLDAVRGPEADPVDFSVVAASAQIPAVRDLLGRRLLDLWPALAGSGVFADLVRVLTGGWPWEHVLPSEAAEVLPLTEGRTRLRAIRAGSRVIVHWRHEPPADPSKIREWAVEHGYAVSHQGRLPAEVRRAYDAAHRSWG